MNRGYLYCVAYEEESGESHNSTLLVLVCIICGWFIPCWVSLSLCWVLGCSRVVFGGGGVYLIHYSRSSLQHARRHPRLECDVNMSQSRHCPAQRAKGYHAVPPPLPARGRDLFASWCPLSSPLGLGFLVTW